jgi:hypothetical protein
VALAALAMASLGGILDYFRARERLRDFRLMQAFLICRRATCWCASGASSAIRPRPTFAAPGR